MHEPSKAKSAAADKMQRVLVPDQKLAVWDMWGLCGLGLGLKSPAAQFKL